MKVEVFRACKENIDDIVNIENLSFAIPWTRKSITDEITKNSCAVYYCASVDGKVAGYAGLWQICDEGHITNIAVHPDYRENGIGAMLLQKLVEYSDEAGLTGLTLEVRKSNIPAISLYSKFGFESAGIRKGYYADNGEDAIIMWRRKA